MSSLKQCDICERMIKNKPDLPEHWISLSRINLDGDNMHFGQIDICNACRSFLNEFYEDLESGSYTVNADFLLKAKTTRKVLRFILDRTADS